ncbi:MAG: glycosyltransferase, partial [Oscillospiraceae bacterium]|nr:glycosyltransferase [Oscillospiraceae bacterium]
MSTYNGEKFLRQQLESVLNQQGVVVELHIRDDGSQDSTVNILNEFSYEHSNISYYSGEKNLGPCGSFFELMCVEHDADFYALSDQDDVCDKDKL